MSKAISKLTMVKKSAITKLGWALRRLEAKYLVITPRLLQKLRWYVEELKKMSPGTYAQLEYDSSTRKFSRLFIAFYACIQGFNDCRPLLFLDGTFLKGRTKGTLLAATAKDGNQGMILTMLH